MPGDDAGAERMYAQEIARRGCYLKDPGVWLFHEEEHEPAECDGADDHDKEKGQAVADPVFCLRAADEGQDQGDEEGIDDHGQEVAFEDHDFFPAAMSYASRATKKLRSPAPAM